MRIRRGSPAALLVSVACAWLLPAGALAEQEIRIDGKTVHVGLEMAQDAVYPGQELLVKLIFRGEGADTRATFNAGAFARESFTVKDARGSAPRGRNASPASGKGLTVVAFDTVESVINLSQWYPKLTARTGSWEVTWTHGDLRVGPLRIRITKAYNPEKDLRAVLETDLGRMTWTLMPSHAPRHVKHFVDLARQGFYDGLTIFRATPGLYALGGDPKGDGSGGWDMLLPPEMSEDLDMQMGLVGAFRRETSMTSHCIFFILLGPNDYMKGKQTFFARVTEGLEVAARLFRVPSRGETQDEDAYTLLTPVKIHRVTIRT